MFGLRPASDNRFSVLVQVGNRLIGAMKAHVGVALVALAFSFAFFSGAAPSAHAHVQTHAGVAHIAMPELALAMPDLALLVRAPQRAAPQRVVFHKIEANRRMVARVNMRLPQRPHFVFAVGSENAADFTVKFAAPRLGGPAYGRLAWLGSGRAPPLFAS